MTPLPRVRRLRARTVASSLLAGLVAMAFAACGSAESDGRSGDGEQPGTETVPSGSQPVRVGTLTLRYVRVPESGSGSPTSVYARIESEGPPDHLVAIASAAAAAGSLHRMRHEDGYMSMEPVDSMEVPAGGHLDLQPGGLHGMLEGLDRPLAAGDSVRLLFGFASGTIIEVTAPVVALEELIEEP